MVNQRLLFSHVVEHEDAVADLKQQVKAAKKEQKQLSMKLEQSEEECSEVKQEVGTFTKSLADMKKKRKEEKTKHDEELEELRAQHEVLGNTSYSVFRNIQRKLRHFLKQ